MNEVGINLNSTVINCSVMPAKAGIQSLIYFCGTQIKIMTHLFGEWHLSKISLKLPDASLRWHDKNDLTVIFRIKKIILKTAQTIAILTLSFQAIASDDLWSIYQLAAEQDPIWQAKVAEVSATKTTVAQSWSYLLPNIQWQGHVNHQRQRTLQGSAFFANARTHKFESRDQSVSLKQPLFRSSSWVELGQAYLASEHASETLRAEKMALILRTAERYFNVLIAQNNLVFADAEKKAVQKHLEEVTERVKVGTVAVVDQEEAKARTDLAAAQVLEAQNALDNEVERLKEITGKNTSELKKLKKEIPLLEPVPHQLDVWQQKAVTQNPSILTAELALQSAQKEVWKIRSRHLPTLDLVGTTIYNKTDGRYGDLKARDNTIGMELTIPLFQGGGTLAKTQEAIYKLEAAKQLFINAQRVTESQIKQAFLGVLSSISRVKALQQALASTKKALEATQEEYLVGTRSMVELLNAGRDVYRTQKEFEQTKVLYILNTLKLKQAAGALSEEDLRLVSEWLV